ncbi:MAG: hypothetical protein ACTHKG_05795 [Nocardioides sp.]
MQALRMLAIGLGGMAVLLWLASYSWIVGLAPPTRWISADASPWLVAETAAAVLGLGALGTGSLVAWRSPAGTRRAPLVAAASGGFAMTLSVLSIVA